jgi:D-tyrosyl-tRNA(Tyr) deacylase
MIGLLQRVTEARVSVGGEVLAEIGVGLMVLVGIERGDTATEAVRLARRLTDYRVFPDADGRMNLSLKDAGGDLLLVPQFTLVADTERGNRPGFSRAAEPATARQLFAALVNAAEQRGATVSTGRFGADMQVCLCNDGPVTISLRVAPGD